MNLRMSSGKLSAKAANATGLLEGTPVVGGGEDQAAGAIGNGIVQSGVISATLGTSGVVFAYSDTVETDAEGRLHTFCHAVRNKWHQMGVVSRQGEACNGIGINCAGYCGRSQNKIDPYEILTASAAEAPLGAEGLYFLPYLTGERTPHANPNARGAWIGLSPRHGRTHLVRNHGRGDYSMRDSLELIKGLGVPITEIRASGGGARSDFWRQMQADVYGHPVVTINASEGPAYGVALLAAAGTGAYSNVVEACKASIQVVSRTKPAKLAKDFYDKAYPIYGQLYRSLKSDFDRLPTW